ncbi:MAG: ComF family protein [Vulcanimicrobiaceae bacterium]
MFSGALAALFPATCFGCGDVGSPLCPRCAAITARARTLQVGAVRVRAAGRYAGIFRRTVIAYKRGRRDAGDALGALLVAAARPFVPPDSLLVPVPTLAGRRRTRGFDQSVRLARMCGAALDVPVILALAQTSCDAQRGRDRSARLHARGRFACVAPHLVAGARVVLVDDVVTTGSTLDDCAQTLVRRGAHVAGALVLAYA